MEKTLLVITVILQNALNASVQMFEGLVCTG